MKNALFILLLLALPVGGVCAPAQWRNNVGPDLPDRLLQMEILVENLEQQLEQLHRLVDNQQCIIETLRQKQRESQEQVKQSLGSHTKTWEEHISDLQKQTGEERHRLEAFAKETEKALSNYKKKIEGLEKKCANEEKKNRHLEESLQVLLRSLDESEEGTNLLVHVVVSGDTLDKIAHNYHTSVRAIKEANGLSNDKIIVGKKLRIPQDAALASR